MLVSFPKLHVGIDLNVTVILSLAVQPMLFVACTQYRPLVVAVKLGLPDPSCQRKVFVLPVADELSTMVVPPQTNVSGPRLIFIPLVLTCFLKVSGPQLVNFINSTL